MSKIVNLIKNKKIAIPTVVTVVIVGVAAAVVAAMKSQETPELEASE